MTDRDDLREHLVTSRIAGKVDTPRDNNLRNYRAFSARDERYLFGLDPQREWSPADVLTLMAERCGVSPDPGYTYGPDTIDPDLTIGALDRMRDRLQVAAAGREQVLVATGHPAGVLQIHLAVVAALRAAGCPILTPAPGWTYRTDTHEHREIRHLGGVAVVSNRGGLNHTHSALPLFACLEALAEAGEAPPDLVVADHGWTGGAGQAGIDAMGFADSNDPALFAGEAEGTVLVTVPLDDNVRPHLYDPVAAYLLAGWA